MLFADVLELQCDPASQLSMGISDICRKLRNPGHTGIVVCCPSHAGPQEALWGLSAYINHTGTSRPLVFPSVQALTRKETQFSSFFIGILKAIGLFTHFPTRAGPTGQGTGPALLQKPARLLLQCLPSATLRNFLAVVVVYTCVKLCS